MIFLCTLRFKDHILVQLSVMSFAQVIIHHQYLDV